MIRAALLLLVGCGGAPEVGAPELVEPDEPLDVDCSDAVPTDGAFLGVTVLDVDGSALGRDDVDVRYCRGARCVVASCIEGNVFHLGGLARGTGSLEIVPIGPRVARRSTLFVPLAVDDDSSTAITVHVPPLDKLVPVPASPGEVEVAVGLYLTVGIDDLVDPATASPAGLQIGGVDATPLALPIQGLDREVLAVYHLAPFDLATRCTASNEAGACVSRRALPVRVDNRWSSGRDGLVLWTGDVASGTWRRLGVITRDRPGPLASPVGIDHLTTLVVTRGP